MTYHLAIGESKTEGPFVESEWLQWTRGGRGHPFRFVDFARGSGSLVIGELPTEKDELTTEKLVGPDVLAITTFGKLAKHPRVNALQRLIAGWQLSHLSADATRGFPEAGPQERLSQTGDNLPNVIQYLAENHRERLDQILDMLAATAPPLERIETKTLDDGRLLLQVKDAPFSQPILARYASDGTLKLLAYLVMLYDPRPPPLIGIEEPENQLHPKLLPELAEECRGASARTQLIVTTHSPFFVNGVRPNELWALYRGGDGYTHAKRASDMPGIPEFAEEDLLGALWAEGHFEVGSPDLSKRGARNGLGK